MPINNNLVTTNQFEIASAAPLDQSSGKKTLRLCLNPHLQERTKIAARDTFVDFFYRLDIFLSHFYIQRRWVKIDVYAENENQTKTFLINIESLRKRTFYSREEILSWTPAQLSEKLARLNHTEQSVMISEEASPWLDVGMQNSLWNDVYSLRTVVEKPLLGLVCKQMNQMLARNPEFQIIKVVYLYQSKQITTSVQFNLFLKNVIVKDEAVTQVKQVKQVVASHFNERSSKEVIQASFQDFLSFFLQNYNSLQPKSQKLVNTYFLNNFLVFRWFYYALFDYVSAGSRTFPQGLIFQKEFFAFPENQYLELFLHSFDPEKFPIRSNEKKEKLLVQSQLIFALGASIQHSVTFDTYQRLLSAYRNSLAEHVNDPVFLQALFHYRYFTYVEDTLNLSSKNRNAFSELLMENRDKITDFNMILTLYSKYGILVLSLIDPLVVLKNVALLEQIKNDDILPLVLSLADPQNLLKSNRDLYRMMSPLDETFLESCTKSETIPLQVRLNIERCLVEYKKDKQKDF